jgi:transposase
MAAVSASRTNPILNAFYQRLRVAGKSAKLALTAVMRKMFCLPQFMHHDRASLLAAAHEGEVRSCAAVRGSRPFPTVV